MFNFRKGCVLLNTKKGNFDFFKNGLFKIKNILTYHCTHVWYCSPTLRMFLTFFCDLIVSFEQCVAPLALLAPSPSSPPSP